MINTDEIIAAIDIGTTKIVAIAGKVTSNGELQILGLQIALQCCLHHTRAETQADMTHLNQMKDRQILGQQTSQQYHHHHTRAETQADVTRWCRGRGEIGPVRRI